MARVVITAMTHDVPATSPDEEETTCYDKDRYTDLVTSEVHEFKKEESVNLRTGAVLSRFEFTYPSNYHIPGKPQDACRANTDGSSNCDQDSLCDSSPASTDTATDGICFPVDKDGDLLVERIPVERRDGVVIIEHQQSTTLSLVGEQVWRGAMFLADYLLYSVARANFMHQTDELIPTAQRIDETGLPSLYAGIDGNSLSLAQTNAGKLRNEDNDVGYVDVRGKHVLELASGVGLTSIVAGMIADKVVVTDIHRGNILRLIRDNLARNQHLTEHSTLVVRELDFCNHSTIDNLAEDLKDVTVVLAADVVYHNELTDAFFATVRRLLSFPPDKVLLVALEKRYVFTLADLDAVAPCYEYFLQCLERLTGSTGDAPTGGGDTKPGTVQYTVQRISSTCFPQYFAYDRTKDLIMFKIQARIHQG